MIKYTIRVWCMTASYIEEQEGEDFNDAVQRLKRRIMPDMRGWSFSEVDND